MGQIQPIVPALPAQPAVSSESPASADSGQFSPHLAKAITKQHNPTAQNEKPASQANQKKDPSNSKAYQENNASTAEAMAPEMIAANLLANAFDADINATTPVGDSGEEPAELQLKVVALPPSSMGAVNRPFSPQIAAMLQNMLGEPDPSGVEQPTTAATLAGDMGIMPTGSNAYGQTSVHFGKETNFFLDQSSQMTVNLQIVNTTAVNKNNPANGTPGQDTLLVQLQQLINNSSETGQVTITSTTTQATDTTLSVAMSPLAAQVFLDDVDLDATLQQKNTNPLSGSRQTTQQQYYEMKMALQAGKETNDQDPDAAGQDKEQDSQNKSGTQQGASLAQTPTALPGINEKGAAVHFAPALTAATAADSSLVDTPKTITLPSGLIVHEQEIIQQMIERFQFMHRAQDTRLNIRLHPAELGELKIDLTVHEGAIRANVIAQSQHVQEILERNIVKLRTILENQGFTVDEIGFATQSDNVNDFNMFDNQFYNDQDVGSGSSHQKTAAGPSDPFTIPSESKTTETHIGVNVTA